GLSLPVPSSGSLEVNFRPDPSIGDGQRANNPWLQELPKPLTKLTWDNAAMMSPLDASRLALANGEEIELALDGRTVIAPVWIVPGHASGSLTLHLGYGRWRAGRIGTGAGFNAGALRTRKSFVLGMGASLKKTG